MATTYILKHQGSNGHPEVCDEQERFFQSINIPFSILDWPTGDGSGLSSGEERVSIVKSRFDFSKLANPFIIINGHGQLHGRTFFFVDGLQKDLAYYQMDAHIDAKFADEGELDCASHVHRTMELSNVKKIKLLGINPFNLTDGLGFFMGDSDTGLFVFSPSPAMYNQKVELYLGEKWEVVKKEASARDVNPFYDLRENIERLEKYGRQYLIEKEFNPSRDEPHAYISIDLDVIRGFPTGWPNGGLWNIERVISNIATIAQSKKVIGADICGLDISSVPERPLSKKRKEKALKDIARIHSTLETYMN